MLTNTSYKQHIYNEIAKKIHVITYKTEYNKILNSSNFFLTELEEMKSCKNREETVSTGMGLQLCWHLLLVKLFEETLLFTSRRVCKIHFLMKLCNHYPMLTLHNAGLPVDNSKGVTVKSWSILY